GLRLVGLLVPAGLDVGGRPRAAREDSGPPVHALSLGFTAVDEVRRRKHWGWGFADEEPSLEELRGAAAGLAEHLGFGAADVEEPVALERLRLPAPRVAPPDLCDARADDFYRARFGLGGSYADVVRGFRGQVPHPPDAVLFPRDEREVEAALEWAAGANVAVIPVGGGTSVVGGIEPRVPGRFDGAVSLSLAAFDRVHEVDRVSRAARVGAGLPGPALEERLGAAGMTMRFYPQSFELSTVGGWIARRATAARTCSCSASSRPTTRSRLRSSAGSSCAARPAASPIRRAAAAPAPGARPSCARRTCATRSSPWACSRRPSRPRSRGSASARCTRPRSAPPAARSTTSGQRSPAGSRTPIRTARRPTSRCWRRRAAARRPRNGTRSSAPSPTPCWRP